ncbi:MAG: ethanolamine ammonia-lyase reactivating factor EutA [Oscillospiraceae bacterium]|nr:ethanolamine ammonia-lyase reactivating factor EutA [Oscillospiraceae bacterium]
MGTELLSVGLDVGTTTTQLIFSSLTVANQASRFSAPIFAITDRTVLYRSPVYFTPLKGFDLVDGDALRCLVEAEYKKAGIAKEDVDTGAIIITGETSRKENAREVLQALSGFAGDFVAATAGPDLESVLAAKGAGAVEFSKSQNQPILHMDIGGGTTNLTLIRDGKILRTGCFNVGGRLLRHENGRITYVSPVLQAVTALSVGDTVSQSQLKELGVLLSSVLEMAAGLTPSTALTHAFLTQEASSPWVAPEEKVILSFSGGVAACIREETDLFAFGDIGPVLGQAIKKSLLCKGTYLLGEDAIRATVIGAGSHSAQLSGSTVFAEGVSLPLKNMPAIMADGASAALDGEEGILVLPELPHPDYAALCALAESLAALELPRYLICTGQDIAKALGQKLRLLMPHTPCLCIDGIYLTENSYLDIGAPVGTAFPVVIKTLVFGS